MPIERWDDEKLDKLANSVDELKNSTTELRLTASALLETVIIHQQNFEVIIARIDQMQSEIRGLQTENRRIFEIISQQQDNDNS